MEPQEDRRVRRTRQALREALVSLILERGFDAITVSEIAARADVGRTTFYAHYADKEDLLQGSLETLAELLRGATTGAVAHHGHAALAFVRPMLEHAEEQAELYAALTRGGGGPFMRDLIHDIWCDLLREHVHDEVAVHAIAGALGATLEWWLTKASARPPAEIAERFCAVFEPGLVAPG